MLLGREGNSVSVADLVFDTCAKTDERICLPSNFPAGSLAPGLSAWFLIPTPDLSHPATLLGSVWLLDSSQSGQGCYLRLLPTLPPLQANQCPLCPQLLLLQKEAQKEEVGWRGQVEGDRGDHQTGDDERVRQSHAEAGKRSLACV